MSRILFLAFLALVPLSAATMPVFDRGTFNLLAPGLPVEDFEEGRVSDPGIQSMGTTLDEFTNNGIFQPGEILPGLRISAAQGLDILNNWSFAATKNIFDSAEQDPVTLTFYRGGALAVGFDLLGEFTENAPENVTAFDAAGNVLSVVTLAPPGSGMFIGFVSDVPIDHILLDVGFEVRGVDNVAFANVPEPSTFGLLTAALLAIARIARGPISRARAC